jgi:hypothetical protein
MSCCILPRLKKVTGNFLEGIKTPISGNILNICRTRDDSQEIRQSQKAPCDPTQYD